ncbi:MAG: hypothetical protein V7L28_30600 [Nostoc sp.]
MLSPLLKVIVDAPADVSVGGKTETYNHPMGSPINQTFDQTIVAVSLSPPNQTYENGAGTRACPLPTIDGQTITSDFDNYYADNTGTCNYKIQLMGITVNGKAYPSKDGLFTVTCDDDCPEGSHKCIHNKYPGYCCIACAQVANRINNIAKKIR